MLNVHTLVKEGCYRVSAVKVVECWHKFLCLPKLMKKHLFDNCAKFEKSKILVKVGFSNVVRTSYFGYLYIVCTKKTLNRISVQKNEGVQDIFVKDARIYYGAVNVSRLDIRIQPTVDVGDKDENNECSDIKLPIMADKFSSLKEFKSTSYRAALPVAGHHLLWVEKAFINIIQEEKRGGLRQSLMTRHIQTIPS